MEKPVPPPLRLENVNHFHQPAGQQPHPRTILKGLECVELMTGGRGWIRDGTDWREVLPGDLIWNSPGDETIARSDPSNPYSCLAVVFKVRRRPVRTIRRFSVWEDLQEVRTLTSRAVDAYLDPYFDHRALADFLYQTLLFHVRRYETVRRMERYPAGIRSVIDTIEADYAHPLRIEHLARVAGWSTAHLHEMFRNHVGVSPHQLLLQRRLRAAKELLLAKTESVKEIANACGFGNSPAFVRVFKKHTGRTPAVFRQHYLSA